MKTNFCPACGIPVPPSTERCYRCGYPLRRKLKKKLAIYIGIILQLIAIIIAIVHPSVYEYDVYRADEERVSYHNDIGELHYRYEDRYTKHCEDSSNMMLKMSVFLQEPRFKLEPSTLNIVLPYLVMFTFVLSAISYVIYTIRSEDFSFCWIVPLVALVTLVAQRIFLFREKIRVNSTDFPFVKCQAGEGWSILFTLMFCSFLVGLYCVRSNKQKFHP